MNKSKQTTITIYPSGLGTGYVICENPETIIDYGIMNFRSSNNRQHLKRLRPYLDYFQPEAVIIRSLESNRQKMSLRIQQVIRAIIDELKEREINVYMYNREEIKQTFMPYNRPTKFGINNTISTWYPELKVRQPQERKNHNPEHYQTGLFDAFSLMLTHFTER